mmetsp:Transcript_19305/g.23896  ORF Transcript_19305/g.23896 Transcript_19305/m.23896 type:complete len:80 (-) Transcript_19305:186-425(-)
MATPAKAQRTSAIDYKVYHDIATSFRDFFTFTLKKKLGDSRSHTYKGESYTLDMDIIKDYESVTIKEWLNQTKIKNIGH